MIASGNIAHTHTDTHRHRGGIKAADFPVCVCVCASAERERGFRQSSRVPKTCALFALAGRTPGRPPSLRQLEYLFKPSVGRAGRPHAATRAQHPRRQLIPAPSARSPRADPRVCHAPFQRDLMDRSEREPVDAARRPLPALYSRRLSPPLLAGIARRRCIDLPARRGVSDCHLCPRRYGFQAIANNAGY